MYRAVNTVLTALFVPFVLINYNKMILGIYVLLLSALPILKELKSEKMFVQVCNPVKTMSKTIFELKIGLNTW